MKEYFLFAVLLVCLSGANARSQSRVTCTLSVSDNVGSSQTLTLGLDTAASDGIDTVLGEAERPPLPPIGAFEARFIGDDIGVSLGQGSLVDYREGSIRTNRTCLHEIEYQAKSGGTQIIIAWNVIRGVSLRIRDVITGSLIDTLVSGSGSYTITNPGGFTKLKLTATYDASVMSTDVTGRSALQPAGFELEQNYPNPFNPSTTIRVHLAAAAQVSLLIYDMTGAVVGRLVDRETLRAGTHSYSWDAAGRGRQRQATGVYIVRMLATPVDQAARVVSKSMKIILLK